MLRDAVSEYMFEYERSGFLGGKSGRQVALVEEDGNDTV